MNLKRIYLRKKPNTNGTTTLFLEYYYGFSKDIKGKLALKRKYEFFNPAIQIITEPKNADERKNNKEIEELAYNILKSKQIEVLKDTFDFNNGKKQNINFFEYFTTVLEKRNLNKSTQLSWKSTLNYLINYCNADLTTFKDIDEKFITGFRDSLNNAKVSNTGRKLHNNTKTTYFHIFKSVISEAIKEKIISENPFDNVKGFKYQESQREYLTVEEIQKLIKTECRKEVDKKAFLFSCLTGLRYSDLQGLKWNQLVKENNNYKLTFKQKKTKGLEYLPLNNQAIKILGNSGKPDELIFQGLYYNNNLSNNISNWCYKAGIKKHITFHSGRHTFATMLLNSGGDLFTVSKLLGHKNINTTLIYTKIIDKTKQEAINRIPEFKIKI